MIVRSFFCRRLGVFDSNFTYKSCTVSFCVTNASHVLLIILSIHYLTFNLQIEQSSIYFDTQVSLLRLIVNECQII